MSRTKLLGAGYQFLHDCLFVGWAGVGYVCVCVCLCGTEWNKLFPWKWIQVLLLRQACVVPLCASPPTCFNTSLHYFSSIAKQFVLTVVSPPPSISVTLFCLFKKSYSNSVPQIVGFLNNIAVVFEMLLQNSIILAKQPGSLLWFGTQGR